MPFSIKGLLASTALALLSATSAGSAAVAATPQATNATATTPRQFDAEQRGVFNGRKVTFRSRVEEFLLGPNDGPAKASVFVTSYESVSPSSEHRPVIFVFNGGPGSSSLWLHMGFLGPRRVNMDDAGAPRTTAPFRLVDNPDSPLDVADIVLLDPPGTGYSSILPGGKPEDFYGVDADARATVEVMRQWLRRHGRENAPKYILSESYGTVRAAVVAKLLAGGPTATGTMDGITLNGVILLGQAMDLPRFPPNDDGIAQVLPSLAATACYHHKVAGECTPAGQAGKARQFLREGYLRALYEGSALPETERNAIARELGALIGIAPEVVLTNDLRIPAVAFTNFLLAGERRRLGIYDARYTLPSAVNGGDSVADDAAMGQYVPAFVGVWNDYARDVLNVRLDRQYEAIAFGSVGARWDFGFGPGIMVGSRNYANDLAAAMTRNPHLKLMVGAGYYDLVTPLGLAEHTIAHAGIPLAATRFDYYESGHMPYLGAASRARLAADVRRFVTE